MELFVALIKPFVGHPGRAFVIAGLFFLILAIGLILRRNRNVFPAMSLAAATLSWLLFGVMEAYAKGSGWNIRVDLLLTAPLLIVISIVAVVQTVRRGAALLAK